MYPESRSQARPGGSNPQLFEHDICQRLKDVMLGLHPDRSWQVLRFAEGRDLSGALPHYLLERRLRHRIVPLGGRQQPLTPYRLLSESHDRVDVTLGLYDLEHPEHGHLGLLVLRFVGPDGSAQPQCYLATNDLAAGLRFGAELRDFIRAWLRAQPFYFLGARTGPGRPSGSRTPPDSGLTDARVEELRQALAALFDGTPSERRIPNIRGLLLQSRALGRRVGSLDTIAALCPQPIVVPDASLPPRVALREAWTRARSIAPAILHLGELGRWCAEPLASQLCQIAFGPCRREEVAIVATARQGIDEGIPAEWSGAFEWTLDLD